MGIKDLVGHRFPGGERSIEHWENFLLTEATGADPLAGDVAHPVHLFHVPIEGAGITIAELFELAEAEGPDRVGLDSYDWEWFMPLREGVAYRCEGEVRSVEPKRVGGRAFDELVFVIDLSVEGVPAARVTNTWHIWRSA